MLTSPYLDKLMYEHEQVDEWTEKKLLNKQWQVNEWMNEWWTISLQLTILMSEHWASWWLHNEQINELMMNKLMSEQWSWWVNNEQVDEWTMITTLSKLMNTQWTN